MSTLSIAIATYNEELNISRCLESVIDLSNEIIIVDGKSFDNTVLYAKKFPKVKIISTDNKPIFHVNKQIAIDACKSDWILQLDADEVVSPKLSAEISKILSRDAQNIPESGFWIKRKNFFLGRYLSKGGVYPDPTIRLYKNGKARLPCKSVHEQAKVDGTVGILNHDLIHYADSTFSRYLLRNNRYTSLMAQELNNQKLNLNLGNFILFFIIKPVHWFLLSYILHRGYVDGFPGFVFAWYSSLRFSISYIKYYELIKNGDHLSLKKDWD